MRSKREIQCLVKLNEKVNCFGDMIDFLSSEKVISRTETSNLVNELNIELPFEIHKTLEKVLQEELLQLVDYKWEMLPNEKICITIITKQSRRDFTWNC